MSKNKLLPLVNTHTHAAMVAFRGIAEDLSLKKWLEERIWPAEKNKINAKFIYENTQLAIEEMKENGIELFCDMYFFEDQVAKAAKEMKIKVVIGEVLLDSPTPSAKNFDEGLAITKDLIEKYKNDKQVSVSVAPHSIYTVGKDNLIKAKKLAKKFGLVYQIHLAETKEEVADCKKQWGMTPVEYLDSLGVLDKKTLLAHCVWVNDKDIKIMAKRKVSVAHCPLSNLKLGSGIAPVAKMIEAGINVSLGTDGAASSNRLDIWEAGKFAALLQKGITNDPIKLSAQEVFFMMSKNGFSALNFNFKNKIKFNQRDLPTLYN